MLRIELYAKKRLSGLSDASVIVHCPYGYTTDYGTSIYCALVGFHSEAYLVILPVIWI
jgi:hypothetical protein